MIVLEWIISSPKSRPRITEASEEIRRNNELVVDYSLRLFLVCLLV